MNDKIDKVYNSVVIGLGNIGFLYDLSSKPHQILTHTRAYLEHPGFKLIGGVEVNSERREIFEEHTGIKAYGTIDELFQNSTEKIDCVSICTPTDLHLSTVESVIKFPIEVIILEKPIALLIDHGKRILSLAQEIKIAVNYVRRWDPGIIGVKRLINEKTLGSPIIAQCFYQKGLFNSASHGIDLFHYWIGEEQKALFLRDKKPGLKEISPDFLLRYDKFDAIFQSGLDYNLALFEIDILFERGRIKITKKGWDIKVSSINCKGNAIPKSVLVEKPLPVNPEMDRYQYNVFEGIYQSLIKSTDFTSDAQSAFKTLQTCTEIKNQMTGGFYG